MKRILLILMIAMLISTPLANAALKSGGNIATWTALSTDTKPSWSDAGETCYETDTGKMFVYNGSAWSLIFWSQTSDPDTLSAAGAGTAESVNGFNLFTVAVGAKGASVDIKWTTEGYISGMGWFNLDNNGSTNLTFVNTDSIQAKTYTEAAAIDCVRVRAYAISATDTLIRMFKFVNEFK